MYDWIPWIILLLGGILLADPSIGRWVEEKIAILAPLTVLVFLFGSQTGWIIFFQGSASGMCLMSGYMLDLLFLRLVPGGLSWIRKVILLYTFVGSSSMPIWAGDNNLAFVFPVFIVACMLGTRGHWANRLTASVLFFCLEMSVCAMLDSYLYSVVFYDGLTRMLRVVAFLLIYVVLCRVLPQDGIRLSERLWKLALGLSAMPLCALLSSVLMTYYPTVESELLEQVSWKLSIAVLPFVFITSMVILITLLVLSDHEQLEQAKQLAEMRESYYENIKRQEKQIRHLRHDMRNHLAVVYGMVEQDRPEQAAAYLQELLETQALQSGKRMCHNEMANVVLLAKEEAMRQYGIQADFRIDLPEQLAIADMDLCALLGNALDNAIEAARKAEEGRVSVQCQCNRGMFMLRVINTFSGERFADLRTTKPDKQRHGFGLNGMREIANRYDGTLETEISSRTFTLTVCLVEPMQG